MNETMSLLLATAILAAGGIGLFMLKTPDDEHLDDRDSEDILLDELEELEDLDNEIYKPKPRSSNKTKRNRKTGGSRRRY